ncbi:MAG: carboxypeptidase regulatory-like domain-containing protein, partial [Terriglobia bacterium]
MRRWALPVVLAGVSLFAQNNASLRGRVTDPQGNAIPKAEIRLYRQDTGALLRTTSENAGTYVFDRLAPGIFVLEVGKEYFRGRTLNVRVESAVDQNVDVSLDVGGVSQSVVVTATGVPQSSDEISKAISLVSSDEIADRNEYSLSEILRSTPGVVITNRGGPGQNISIRIRGLRPDAAAILVDGLRFRDASTTQADASSFMSTLN